MPETNKELYLLVLDPVKTHKDKPSCLMRLQRGVEDNWYCIDCGLTIMWTRVVVPLLNTKNQADGG